MKSPRLFRQCSKARAVAGGVECKSSSLTKRNLCPLFGVVKDVVREFDLLGSRTGGTDRRSEVQVGRDGLHLAHGPLSGSPNQRTDHQRTDQERVALRFRMRLAASTTVNFRSPSFTGTGSMKETGSLAGKLSRRAWSSFSSTMAFNVRSFGDMSRSLVNQHPFSGIGLPQQRTPAVCRSCRMAKAANRKKWSAEALGRAQPCAQRATWRLAAALGASFGRGSDELFRPRPIARR